MHGATIQTALSEFYKSNLFVSIFTLLLAIYIQNEKKIVLMKTTSC